MEKNRRKTGWWQQIPGLSEAVEAKAGITNLSRDLGIKLSSLMAWQKRGVPAGERCMQIHEITGKPLHEIRPDIYPNPKTGQINKAWRVDA